VVLIAFRYVKALFCQVVKQAHSVKLTTSLTKVVKGKERSVTKKLDLSFQKIEDTWRKMFQYIVGPSDEAKKV